MAYPSTIAEYRRGYCTATADDLYITVKHSKYDTPADIARAARECNYRAGNWNRSRLVNIGTSRLVPGRKVTFFRIERI